MNWHRLFGIMLTDIFIDSPYEVELEKDLSLKQQRLDIVIIRKHPGTFVGRLPDGLDDLADHNLVSFKSHQEAFDDWTGDELLGHFVNYRKQLQASNEPMLSVEYFRLYGVCARFPSQLAGQIELNEVSPGVLECRWGVRKMRLIVLRDLPNEEHNAPLHLFSADRNKVQYGEDHFHLKSPKTSTLLNELLTRYQEAGLNMPYTLDDFQRESWERILKEMPLEKRLEGVSNEQLLSRMSTDEIEAYLKKLKGDSSKNAE